MEERGGASRFAPARFPRGTAVLLAATARSLGQVAGMRGRFTQCLPCVRPSFMEGEGAFLPSDLRSFGFIEASFLLCGRGLMVLETHGEKRGKGPRVRACCDRSESVQIYGSFSRSVRMKQTSSFVFSVRQPVVSRQKKHCPFRCVTIIQKKAAGKCQPLS